jgi:hypothetical protein
MTQFTKSFRIAIDNAIVSYGNGMRGRGAESTETRVTQLELKLRESEQSPTYAELHVTLASPPRKQAGLVYENARWLREFQSMLKEVGLRGANSVSYAGENKQEGNVVVLFPGLQLINSISSDESATQHTPRAAK